MAKKNNLSASRGSVNNIILNSLLAGDKYGYEIIKEVEQQTNGKVKLKQPSLYSSLKRFEQKGYITSYWGDSDIGGRRHYYSITPLGRKNTKASSSNSKDASTINENIEDQETNKQKYDVQQYDLEETDEENELFELDENTEEDMNVSIEKKYNTFSVDDKINKLLNNEEEQTTEFSYELINEIEPEENVFDNDEQIEENEVEVYDELFDEKKELVEEITTAIEEEKYDSLQPKTDETNNEMLYDHHFYKPTPLTSFAEKSTDQHNTEEKDDNLDLINKQENEEPQTIKIEQEGSKSKIITDEYGITKIAYDNPDENKPNKVFDNVVIRANAPSSFYESDKIKPHKTLYPEISDEEREIKNQKFMEKFDSITQEKNISVFNKDYKNKLNSLFNEETIETEEIKTNQINQFQYSEESDFDYEEEPQTIQPQNTTLKSLENNGYNIKMYNTKQNSNYKSDYLLVNKAKFVYGIIMFVLMILQITVTMLILKNKNLLFENHFWVYQVAYVVMTLVVLYYCIPVFISPNKQASSPYKFNYSIMFGALTFFVLLLLIYSINTFMGLDYSNIKYFLTTLLVPAILSSNFVIGPIIFKIITLNKRFY